MSYITTILYSFVPNSGWEAETVTAFVSSLSSQSFDITRHASTTIPSTFATSTTTFMSSSSPTSESTSKPRPSFARPTLQPSVLPSTSQPVNFPTGAVIGVCALILILLIVLVSLLAWKGKLARFRLYQNPYVTKMKRQAQNERVRETEKKRLEEARRAEAERAKERGWGVGNERASGEVVGDLPEMISTAK
jgi:hypothetical protein